MRIHSRQAGEAPQLELSELLVRKSRWVGVLSPAPQFHDAGEGVAQHLTEVVRHALGSSHA